MKDRCKALDFLFIRIYNQKNGKFPSSWKLWNNPSEKNSNLTWVYYSDQLFLKFINFFNMKFPFEFLELPSFPLPPSIRAA